MAGYDIHRLAEILRDGVYKVPEYQRNYAWEYDRQVKDLWEDLENVGTAERSDHYTGTLIVKQMDNVTKLGKTYKRFELIDGQQRLTTMTILLYCICEYLISLGNDEAKKTAQNIMSEYIFDADTDIYKLILNEGDDSFFRDVILKSPTDEMTGKRATTASEKRLKEAKRFFSDRVHSLSYEELQELIGKVLNKLIAIRYEVGTEGEAGLIFEVMNDRGRPLSQLDKVKNYLIYLSYKSGDEDLAHSINESWGEILRNTASIDRFDEDSLLRYHWIMYTGESKEYDVHRRLKTKLKLGTPDILSEVRNYVDSLKEASYIFRELNNPEGAFPDWRGQDGTAIKEHLAGLHRLQVMAAFMPLLTACRIVFRNAPDLFSKVVSACEVFAFRVYKVANRRADTGQSTFHWRANILFGQRGSHRSKLESLCEEVMSDIGGYITTYCPEDELTDGLKNHNILQWMERYEVRYLLCELERHKCHEAGEVPLRWKDLEKAQIEHIWPESPRGYEGWPGRRKQEHALFVGQIGNLTLTFWNPELSNKDFSEKREMYNDSSLRIQRELAERDRWTPREIKERNEEIVNFAQGRWAMP